MAYPIEEQETILIFEPKTKKWSVYSCYPKHVRKIMEIADVFDVVESEGSNTPLSVKVTLEPRQVSLKKQTKIDFKEREERRQRALKNFNIKPSE